MSVRPQRDAHPHRPRRFPALAVRAGQFLKTRFPRPTIERAVHPERLRAALEGRAVRVAGRMWRLEVYSVCDCAGRRWVQLALEGDPNYMLTLNLAMGAGVQRALMALAVCLANPSDATGILNVA